MSQETCLDAIRPRAGCPGGALAATSDIALGDIALHARIRLADRYRNEIGPGVYDVHSPRVPGTAEMVDLLK